MNVMCLIVFFNKPGKNYLQIFWTRINLMRGKSWPTCHVTIMPSRVLCRLKNELLLHYTMMRFQVISSILFFSVSVGWYKPVPGRYGYEFRLLSPFSLLNMLVLTGLYRRLGNSPCLLVFSGSSFWGLQK